MSTFDLGAGINTVSIPKEGTLAAVREAVDEYGRVLGTKPAAIAMRGVDRNESITIFGCPVRFFETLPKDAVLICSADALDYIRVYDAKLFDEMGL